MQNIMKELLLNRYGHLADFYKSQQEFEEHFFGGEVKIPAKDLLDLAFEFEYYEKTIYYQPKKKNILNKILRLIGL